MTKRTLADWASIAEIIAAVGVIVSLVFVGYSIQKNTVELQKENSRQIYNAIRELEVAAMTDAELQEAIWMVEKGERKALTDLQLYRFRFYMTQTMTIWEQAHGDLLAGTISDEDFGGWKPFFEEYMGVYLTREDWDAMKRWFGEDFTGMVEASLDAQGL